MGRTLTVCLVFLGLCGEAHSQQPGSVQYNQVVVPGHGAGDTRSGKTGPYWGAIALERKGGGGYGISSAFRSESQAKKMALQECQRDATHECVVVDSFYAYCAAVALGSAHWGFRIGRDEGIRRITEEAQQSCGDSDCRIVYSKCT